MTSSPHRRSCCHGLMARLATASLAAVMLLAIVETVAVTMASRNQVSPQTWDQIETLIRREFHPGDLIIFAPDWMAPIGRLHVGDLLDVQQVSRPDSDGYSRIWVIARAGFGTSDTNGASLQWSRSVGGLTVRLYHRQPALVTFDFYEHVPEGFVRMMDKRGHQAQVCRWDPSRHRHQCRRGWNNVRQKLGEIGYHLRRCLYAHPVDGKILELRYEKVLLGDSFVFYTGLDNYDSRYRARRAWYMAQHHHKPGPTHLGPVVMEVALDGRRLGVVRQPIDERWHRSVLDTSRFAGKRMDVTLRISSDHAYGKNFCFYGQARRKEKSLTRTAMKYP
ncbi:MAG: hypothetical protein J7M25_17420 [Deltaproteobacteria bacterium]|nr:hypothetical protein [Deltaproteobacteria bacterium]